MEKLKVKVVNKSTNPLPEYKTIGSAGMDLRSSEHTVVQAGRCQLVGTGLHIQVPIGYEADVKTRSGLSLKHNIFVLNSPGLVDPDYTGEVKVILMNLGDEDFVVDVGDRIAQLTVTKYETVEWESVSQLEETERGNGGFGHTGVK